LGGLNIISVISVNQRLASVLPFPYFGQTLPVSYFGRVKKDQIVEAIQEATGAPVDERPRRYCSVAVLFLP
jgi:hypothetical protein